MSEVSALRKHPCPECGGDAEWDARKQSLLCPYCGTEVPWSDGEDAFGALIVENDLAAALRDIPSDTRGIGGGEKSVKCGSCQAISVFGPERAAQRCDFCGSPSIIPCEAMEGMITPQALLPAQVPVSKVRDDLRKWYGSRWFAPNKLKRAALTDTVHGVYLPYWTFDAHVDADWRADSGYHYYESRQVRGSDGRMRTERVRKTRWVPSSGKLARFFDDELVPGTVGVHAALLRKVEPFPTITDLKPFDPAYVRGWTVERYQLDLHQAARTAQSSMEEKVRQMCAGEVPGDTHRNLRVNARFRGQTFKHVLVPVWLVGYNYGRKSYQVVVNGHTGKMAGEHPLSWIKITLAVIAVLVAFLLITTLLQAG